MIHADIIFLSTCGGHCDYQESRKMKFLKNSCSRRSISRSKLLEASQYEIKYFGTKCLLMCFPIRESVATDDGVKRNGVVVCEGDDRRTTETGTQIDNRWLKTCFGQLKMVVLAAGKREQQSKWWSCWSCLGVERRQITLWWSVSQRRNGLDRQKLFQ